MLNIIKKIFGSENEREVLRIKKIVETVNSHEEDLAGKSIDNLRDRISSLKEEVKNYEDIDAVIPEVMAIGREASKRMLGLRPFDVQILGAIVLHEGKIAEMKTGEGKTLVAAITVVLNSLFQSVHVVTVNDYLARRDALWMSPIYLSLGLTVGVLNNDKSYMVIANNEKQEEELIDSLRQEVYKCDVIYGTNSEFGFDYLRDNMKYSIEEVVQTSHSFAIVDEVDSILIDEARTPLIISGPSDSSVIDYKQINDLSKTLVDEDLTKDEKTKQVFILDSGIEKIEKSLGLANLYDPSNLITLHAINQALRAIHMYERDKDYVVQENKIIIIDEFTGRLMPSRRWGEGLHQAVEAKERVDVEEENQTLASISIQNYFRMYNKLAGMTGTADTEALEFKNIYDLQVVVVPTNAPMIREDLNDLIYRTESEKFQAILENIVQFNQSRNPVLVGTISVEKSVEFSVELKKRNIVHQVLNAKNHESESEIIAQAGKLGAVTIATNMAGRGTDIKLGGNIDFILQDKNLNKNEILSEIENEKSEILELGGLIVLGTERHESRRIDNQLRGRSGRQGDPGRSQFFVSMEDDLMRLFGSERISSMMTKFGWKDGEPIEHKMITGSLENAQKKVEARNFEMRKYLIEYDDVQNKQREVIYGLRNKLLIDEEVSEILISISDNVIQNIEVNFDDPDNLSDLDQESIINSLGFSIEESFSSVSALENVIIKKVSEKTASLGEHFIPVSKYILITTLDMTWKDHLLNMDYLRDSVGLRAYGQKNPLNEYKKEGFEMFKVMMEGLYFDALKSFLIVEPISNEELERLESERNKQEKVEFLSDTEILESENDVDFVQKEEDNKNKDEENRNKKLMNKAKMEKDKVKRRNLEKQKKKHKRKQRK